MVPALLWFRSVMELHKWLLEQDTDPGAAMYIIRTIKAWRDGSPLPDTVCTGDWHEAFQEQNNIGWHGFFEGFLSPKWAKLQTDSYDQKGKRNTGKRWGCKLIKRLWAILWEFWELRNKNVLDITIAGTSPESEALNLQIQQEYERGLDRIPTRWTSLFQDSLENTQSKTLLYRKEWVKTVDILRRQYGGLDPISPQHEFLINWLERYEGR